MRGGWYSEGGITNFRVFKGKIRKSMSTCQYDQLRHNSCYDELGGKWLWPFCYNQVGHNIYLYFIFTNTI